MRCSSRPSRLGCSILVVRPNTWLSESHYERVPVTLVNLRFPDPAVFTDGRFTAVHADATCLPFADASYDIAFSNSVIEHVTTWERQQAFASEVRRVAPKLWIQTPARCFPIEPTLACAILSVLAQTTANPCGPILHRLGSADSTNSCPSRGNDFRDSALDL